VVKGTTRKQQGGRPTSFTPSKTVTSRKGREHGIVHSHQDWSKTDRTTENRVRRKAKLYSQIRDGTHTKPKKKEKNSERGNKLLVAAQEFVATLRKGSHRQLESSERATGRKQARTEKSHAALGQTREGRVRDNHAIGPKKGIGGSSFKRQSREGTDPGNVKDDRS